MQELGGLALVDLGIAAPRGRAGHGVGADDVAEARHEQLGARSHEPVDVESERVGMRRRQTMCDLVGVERCVGGDDQFTRQDDLLEVA